VPNVKLSELPNTTTLTGTEEVPIVQGGVAKNATVQAIADKAAPAWSAITGKPSTFAPSVLPPVAATFTSASDAYFPVHEAMTLNVAGKVTAGTGTFTIGKALAATPTSFTTITTSTSFAAGDVLKLTAASVTGYCAVTIPRTA
jgi:hypothetical protein